MPTQTEELVNELRAIKARLDYLEAWEGETEGTRFWYIKPAWDLGQATVVGYGPVCQLPDGASSDVYFLFSPPDRFVSFVGLYLQWFSPAAAGRMYWEIATQFGSADEAYDTHVATAGPGSSVTLGTDIINGSSHPSGLDLSALAVDDQVGVRVRRRADLAPDTLGDIVYVYALTLAYRGNM